MKSEKARGILASHPKHYKCFLVTLLRFVSSVIEIRLTESVEKYPRMRQRETPTLRQYVDLFQKRILCPFMAPLGPFGLKGVLRNKLME